MLKATNNVDATKLRDQKTPPSGIGHFLRRIRNRSKSPIVDVRNGRRKCPSTIKRTDSQSNKSDDIDGESTSRFGTLLARISSRRSSKSALKWIDRTNRVAVSEQDLVSKSLIREIDTKKTQNGSLPLPSLSDKPAELTAYYSQESVFDGPERIPSYVRISCTLNGYRHFARSKVTSLEQINGRLSTIRSRPMGESLVERRLRLFERETPSNSTLSPLRKSTNLTLSPLRKSTNSTLSPLRKSTNSSVIADDLTSTSVRQLVDDFDLLCLNGTTDKEDQQTTLTIRPTVEPPQIPPRHCRPTALSSAVGENLTGLLPSTDLLTTSTRHDDDLIFETPKMTMDGQTNDNRDGTFYDDQMRQKRGRLEEQCVKSRAELDENDIPEHAADLLRLAIGKAGLLMRKKLPKFDELIQKNRNPKSDDPRPTTGDDLEGYWALLLLDLEDIESCFSKVERMRSRQWRPDDEKDETKSNGHCPKIMSKSMTGKSLTSPTDPSVSLAKDEQRKSKLAEAKRAGKERRLKQTSGSHDEIQIIF